MPGYVVLIVLLGALLHASWNAVVKSSGDKFLNVVMVIGSRGWRRGWRCRFSLSPHPRAGRICLVSSCCRWSTSFSSPRLKARRHEPCLPADARNRALAGGARQRAADRRGAARAALARRPLCQRRCAGHGAGVRQRGEGAGAQRRPRCSTPASSPPTQSPTASACAFPARPSAYTLWIFVGHAAPLLIWALARSPFSSARICAGASARLCSARLQHSPPMARRCGP